MTIGLSYEALQGLSSKKELKDSGYVAKTISRRGQSEIKITRLVVKKVQMTLGNPSSNKSGEEILGKIMHTHTRSSDLDMLSSSFLYRILPNYLHNDIEKVISEMDYYNNYSRIIVFLTNLEQTGRLSGLEASNIRAAKKWTLDDRAKSIKETIEFLMQEIRKAKNFPQ